MVSDFKLISNILVFAFLEGTSFWKFITHTHFSIQPSFYLLRRQWLIKLLSILQQMYVTYLSITWSTSCWKVVPDLYITDKPVKFPMSVLITIRVEGWILLNVYSNRISSYWYSLIVYNLSIHSLHFSPSTKHFSVI